METTAEVEFRDSDVWDAVEDSVQECIQEQAWDVVRDEVYECAEQAAREYVENNEGNGVTEGNLESLLDELSRRIEQDLTLCPLGQSAKKAITLIAQQVVAEPFATGSTPVGDAIKLENTAQLSERNETGLREARDLVVRQNVRIDDLETQVNMLLEVAQHGGERASSVDRR